MATVKRFGPGSLALLVVASCGGDAASTGKFELPAEVAREHSTAYIDAVVADPPGDDLAVGAGEHLVIRNNASIRIDMGGWWVEAGEHRLPLGIGRQIDVGSELRVHPGPGQTGDDSVFLGWGEEVLDDGGGMLVLRDAGGAEVARLAYGAASTDD